MPKAVVLTDYGPPDVLVWSDVPMPEPGPGQIRVRVQAAGVSPTDPKIRRGDVCAVFPIGPGDVRGFEAAGVVDALVVPDECSIQPLGRKSHTGSTRRSQKRGASIRSAMAGVA